MSNQGAQTKQVIALSASARLGKKLQKDHPEILRMYRRGDTRKTIVQKLDIKTKYSVNDIIAIRSISKMLRGHLGGLSVTPYAGVAKKSELDRLEKKHKLDSLEKIKKEKKGAAGFTREERSRFGKIGGSKAGKITHEKGIGCHSLTKDELKEAGRNAAIARGESPWIQEALGRKSELDFATEVSQLPENQHQKGVSKGKPNWKMVAEIVNSTYHMKRGGEAIRTKIYDKRKKEEKDSKTNV